MEQSKNTWGSLAGDDSQTMITLGFLLRDLKATQSPETQKRIDEVLHTPLNPSLSITRNQRALQDKVINLLRDIGQFDAPVPN